MDLATEGCAVSLTNAVSQGSFCRLQKSQRIVSSVAPASAVYVRNLPAYCLLQCTCERFRCKELPADCLLRCTCERCLCKNLPAYRLFQGACERCFCKEFPAYCF